MSKLYLHVGFHKTGTTALQTILNRNRKQLAELGFLYPKTRKFKAQHEFAWSAANRGWGWKQFGGSFAGPKPAKRMYKALRKSKLDAIISSEFLSELTTDQIQKLLDLIGSRDLKVIFTVRPIAKILPSAYQQEIKNGSKLTYSKWLERVFDTETENRNNVRFWGRHSHHIEIAKWVGVLGKERVSVIISDDSKPDFLSEAFFGLIGVPTDSFREPKESFINRSMDLAEIELIRQINLKFKRELGWDEYVVGVRSSIVKAWTSSSPSENSPGRLATPSQFAPQLEAKAKEIAQGIKDLGVEIIGDLSSLEKASYGENQIPTTIEIANLVDPILSRTREATLDSISSKELLVIVLKRAYKSLRGRAKKALGKKQREV